MYRSEVVVRPGVQRVVLPTPLIRRRDVRSVDTRSRRDLVPDTLSLVVDPKASVVSALRRSRVDGPVSSSVCLLLMTEVSWT